MGCLTIISQERIFKIAQHDKVMGEKLIASSTLHAGALLKGEELA